MMTRARSKAEQERKRKLERKMLDIVRQIARQEKYLRPEKVSIFREQFPPSPDQFDSEPIWTVLPWSTFRAPSSVSHAWRRAINTGQTYAARARSHSTETLAVINHTLSAGIFGISLYSLGNEPRCRERLPPIPLVKTGIPQSCECIALDGKLYILGGLKNPRTELGSKNVYMLNLAEQRQWKKCANMNSARQNFASGIVDGKIYVCGGSSRLAPVRGTEVYDPEADAWTAVMPMPFVRTGHDVAILHGRLFVYGGSFFERNFRKSQRNFRRLPRDLGETLETQIVPEWCYTYPANHVEIYNPVKDRWRRLLLDVDESSADPSRPDERHSDARLLMANSRLFSISSTNFSCFDLETVEWAALHEILNVIGLGVYSRGIDPSGIRAVQALDDDVFIIGGPWFQNCREDVSFLRFHQRGVVPHEDQEPIEEEDREPIEEEDREPPGEPIYWNMVDYNLSFQGLRSPFIRAVQL